MSRTYSVTSFYHGRKYNAELVRRDKSTSFVRIFGWYPFPISIHFHHYTAESIPRGVRLRNGAMILEIIQRGGK